jgi:hypothetical protein
MISDTMQRTRVFLATVALLTIAASASAQIRWGREAVPRSGACFYEDAGFRGRYFCARPGDRLSSIPEGMGDHISSIRTFGEAEVTVFRDRSFRGDSARFFDDIVNLRNQGWNDTISSILVSRRAIAWGGRRGPVWGGGTIPREGACFYENSNFRGRYFCIPRGGSYPSMPSGFNDKISSIRIRGGGVIIFRDEHFSGRSSRINRDVSNLGSSWGDRISSIRVF